MAALSRLIAKELSSALGITDNPKFNPMFKQTDEVLSDVEDPNTSTIAEFYSPLESAIENAPIGKKGTRGENIEAFVRKRAPKVTQAELDYREFSLDPARNYTRGNNSGAIDDGMEPLNIKAVKKRTSNKYAQRQKDLLDEEVGYEEIGVDVTAKDLGLATHYGGSNLAHARYSIRQSSDLPMPEEVQTELGFQMLRPDSRYTLIEELQSDPIQNMVVNRSETLKKTVKEFEENYDEVMEELSDQREFEMAGSFFTDYKDFLFNKYIPISLNKNLSTIEKSTAYKKLLQETSPNRPIEPTMGDLPNRSSFISDIRVVSEVFENMMFEKLNIRYFDQISDVISFLKDNVRELTYSSNMITTKKDTPITSLTDSVRVLLQSIIADSKAKGINEIVIPPIEKLAEKRFSKGSDEYKKVITKGSGFYNTYVVALDKALKQLKAELGNQVKVGTKDLKYKTYISPEERNLAERFPRGDLAKRVAKADKKDSVDILKGKSINIKDLKLDSKTSKLRLNKGGLVQRPNR